MARNRAFKHTDCQCRARAFAQPEAEIEKRLFANRIKQTHMRALRALMPRNSVIQRAIGGFGHNERRGGADKAINNDRNAVLMRRRHRARHCCDLASAKAT